MNYQTPGLPNYDEEHLRLLAIFYYIFAALSVATSLLLVLYAVFFLFITHIPQTFATGQHSPPPPMFIFNFFAVLMFLGVIVAWVLAFCTFHAGRSIQQRKNYTFVLVMAALHCLHAPFGTALGVCTIIVLTKPGVKYLFGQGLPVQIR